MNLAPGADEDYTIDAELEAALQSLLDEDPRKPRDYTDDFSPKIYHDINTPPTEAPAIAEVIPTVAPAYTFPHADPEYQLALIRYQDMSAETLNAKLHALSSCIGKSQDANHYVKNRIDACAISVALNMKCRFPPFTRSFWKNKSKPKGTKWSINENILANDMRVIDLHWLYSNLQLNPLGQCAEMFSSSFDFAMASHYVSEPKTSNTKAIELGLSHTHMLSLMTLKSTQVYERHRIIKDQLRHGPSLISNEMMKPRCRLSNSESELLDISSALLLADGNLMAAEKIYTHITGSSIPESTLRKKMVWLSAKKIISFSRASKA